MSQTTTDVVGRISSEEPHSSKDVQMMISEIIRSANTEPAERHYAGTSVLASKLKNANPTPAQMTDMAKLSDTLIVLYGLTHKKEHDAVAVGKDYLRIADVHISQEENSLTHTLNLLIVKEKLRLLRRFAGSVEGLDVTEVDKRLRAASEIIQAYIDSDHGTINEDPGDVNAVTMTIGKKTAFVDGTNAIIFKEYDDIIGAIFRSPWVYNFITLTSPTGTWKTSLLPFIFYRQLVIHDQNKRSRLVVEARQLRGGDRNVRRVYCIEPRVANVRDSYRYVVGDGKMTTGVLKGIFPSDGNGLKNVGFATGMLGTTISDEALSNNKELPDDVGGIMYVTAGYYANKIKMGKILGDVVIFDEVHESDADYEYCFVEVMTAFERAKRDGDTSIYEKRIVFMSADFDVQKVSNYIISNTYKQNPRHILCANPGTTAWNNAMALSRWKWLCDSPAFCLDPGKGELVSPHLWSDSRGQPAVRNILAENGLGPDDEKALIQALSRDKALGPILVRAIGDIQPYVRKLAEGSLTLRELIACAEKNFVPINKVLIGLSSYIFQCGRVDMGGDIRYVLTGPNCQDPDNNIYAAAPMVEIRVQRIKQANLGDIDKKPVFKDPVRDVYDPPQSEGYPIKAAMIAYDRHVNRPPRSDNDGDGYFRDILIFLPGNKEINDSMRYLEKLIIDGNLDDIPLLIKVERETYHDDEVQKHLEPELSERSEYKTYESMRDAIDAISHIGGISQRKWTRRIFFSTDVFETGRTISTLRYVIDSGFHKRKMYNPLIDGEGLFLSPITNDIITQRRGRLGRMGDDIEYEYIMMFPEKVRQAIGSEESGMLYRQPGILYNDVSRIVYMNILRGKRLTDPGAGLTPISAEMSLSVYTRMSQFVHHNMLVPLTKYKGVDKTESRRFAELGRKLLLTPESVAFLLAAVNLDCLYDAISAVSYAESSNAPFIVTNPDLFRRQLSVMRSMRSEHASAAYIIRLLEPAVRKLSAQEAKKKISSVGVNYKSFVHLIEEVDMRRQKFGKIPDTPFDQQKLVSCAKIAYSANVTKKKEGQFFVKHNIEVSEFYSPLIFKSNAMKTEPNELYYQSLHFGTNRSGELIVGLKNVTFA